MKDTAFIYGLRAASSNQYFYIGSTRQSLKDRFDGHKSLARTGKHYNRHLMHTMRQIGIEHVICEPIEACPVADQFQREHDLINQYLAEGHALTNLKLTPHLPSGESLDPYIARVTTPERLLVALQTSQREPGTAEDPRYQAILEGFHAVIVTYLDHANQRLNGRLRHYLEEAAEQELHGHSFFAFMNDAEAEEAERRAREATKT